MKYVLSMSAALALLIMPGCTRDISGDVYSDSSINGVSSTHVGVIVNARQVVVKNEKLSDNVMGGVMGGIAGGALGNMVGGGRTRVLTTTTGALAGATLGAMAEDKLSKQTAMEYIVRMERTGNLYTIVQGKDRIYVPGQRVYLSINSQGRSRIVSLAQ